MNKLLPLNLGALIAFLLACGSIALLSGQAPNHGDAAPNAVQHSLDRSQEVFKLYMIGEARASDGTPLGMRTYTGSRGTAVSIMYGTFESAEKSKAELQRWIDNSNKLIQREPNRNSSGEILGERVLLTYTDSRKHLDYPVLVWTNGADFFRIKSFSLPAVLQFEERIKNGASLIDPPQTK